VTSCLVLDCVRRALETQRHVVWPLSMRIRKAERLASFIIYTCQYNIMCLAKPTVILSGLPERLCMCSSLWIVLFSNIPDGVLKRDYDRSRSEKPELRLRFQSLEGAWLGSLFKSSKLDPNLEIDTNSRTKSTTMNTKKRFQQGTPVKENRTASHGFRTRLADKW
jgi:hypothetical protein